MFNDLITFASWEDRFLLGQKEIITKYQINRVLVYYYSAYEKWSQDNRDELMAFCGKKGIKITEKRIESEQPQACWKVFEDEFKCKIWNDKKILLDISTMPRETIWFILYNLNSCNSEINYIYNKPEKYAQDWLSKDPGNPRLIFKMSGIHKFDNPTMLIILTGFDSERTSQLINYYEPKKTFIGFQKGDQFENQKLNIEKHMKELKGYLDWDIFYIDSYQSSHGYEEIKNIIEKNKNQFNIIATSLGPKPAAISLFRLAMEFNQIGLVYTPSKDFNRLYSSGFSQLGEINRYERSSNENCSCNI